MIKNILIVNKDNTLELVFCNSNFFQIGPNYYYYTLDRISGTKFILEAEAETKQKKIRKAAREIKNAYINEFTSTMLLNEEEIKARKDKLKTKFKELFDWL